MTTLPRVIQPDEVKVGQRIQVEHIWPDSPTCSHSLKVARVTEHSAEGADGIPQWLLPCGDATPMAAVIVLHAEPVPEAQILIDPAKVDAMARAARAAVLGNEKWDSLSLDNRVVWLGAVRAVLEAGELS